MTVQTQGRITMDEARKLYCDMPLLRLGQMADSARKTRHPQATVTFIVDRNINYTNVCINRCSFCAFYRDEHTPQAYVIDREELLQKVQETVELGGTQVLIQGGLHPGLDLSFYTGMLESIKERFQINIHGFSPPEIHYIAAMAGMTTHQTLLRLRQAGLDSIPGGGAEVLSDRVRQRISPRKINTAQWLDVMRQAHAIGMRTTATMMFGTIETIDDILQHLDAIRSLQDDTGGFTAFIPWSFQPGNSELGREVAPSTAVDYLRVLALSRLYLDNIPNIQASWVTQGVKMAQVALRFGANDFGSTMIEENVVKAAGISFKTSKDDIIRAIRAAGFRAAQRDTYYNIMYPLKKAW
ncbi:cyclic dehypoxanthinyl futalosine synthase [Candidatus Magnetobacterium casense]|uniref:cyclic dehypoxanthinyl futalosine synthase n=1 Tax=Candidatus Magnetobacterium casense TaxID=1455061 RepID=UPI00058D6C5C|nr:cyclic dehypoxanthinyl futalosine synthase [Candidatus Magnetobacterium casensis]